MKRVKIIEDDDAIRTELKTLLSTNGYQPVEGVPVNLFLWMLICRERAAMPSAGSCGRLLHSF